MEIVIFPEMLVAGAEAIAECEQQQRSAEDTAMAVYCAMECVKTLAIAEGPESVN